jgi:hypothetical protein
MESMYIITKFVGVSHGINRFHFIGYFSGVRINKILISGGDFERGNDYVLLISEMKNIESTLYAKLIKSKKIV